MRCLRGDCVQLGGGFQGVKRHRRSALPVVCKVAVKERGAVLCKRLQGHQSAVTAGIVVSSAPGVHRIATASLDKTIAFWEIIEDKELKGAKVRTCKISLHGGPAFSLLSDSDRDTQGAPFMFCGTAKEGLVIWDPHTDQSVSRVLNPPHSGWVRALDSHGKWIVSCDCNNLRLMDSTWRLPRQVDVASLFTGDILDVSIQGKTIFASATNGSIHRWEIATGGNLHKTGSVDDAHDGRVTAIVHHKNLVYTTGFDGNLKMWDATTFDCLKTVPNAHSGKINAATMGSDGLLHTGGDDGLINRWHPKTLAFYAYPLVSHRHPVRVLSMGKGHTLVSGDASGLISVWELEHPKSR